MSLFDRDLDEIEVSDKHVPLRIALFALAFILAVTAFAFAVTGLGHKDAGYYTIAAEPNDASPLYASGVSLRYYCDGESESIKAILREVEQVYGSALLESYRTLNAVALSPTQDNLAALNQNIGKPVSVSPALCAVLLDALEKTEEDRGFNLFAGPLYAEWTALLYLEHPDEFDPLNDPDEAERLERLAALAADHSLYSLRVLDEESCTLQLDVDERVLQTLEELELDAPILDLNLLHDAYELRMVAQKLSDAGFASGYLSADSGLSIALPALREGEYRLYALTAEGAVPAAAAIARGGTAASQFHAFAFEEGDEAFYTVADAQGQLHLRHPYLLADGQYREKLLSSLVLDLGGDAVAACYENIRLNSFETLRESRDYAASMSRPALCTAASADRIVYCNAAASAISAADSDYGFELEEIT